MSKEYRITSPRPIGGRMRKIGEIVTLDERQHRAEAGWGGLEEVAATPAGKTPTNPRKGEKPAD